MYFCWLFGFSFLEENIGKHFCPAWCVGLRFHLVPPNSLKLKIHTHSVATTYCNIDVLKCLHIMRLSIKVWQFAFFWASTCYSCVDCTLEDSLLPPKEKYQDCEEESQFKLKVKFNPYICLYELWTTNCIYRFMLRDIQCGPLFKYSEVSQLVIKGTGRIIMWH